MNLDNISILTITDYERLALDEFGAVAVWRSFEMPIGKPHATYAIGSKWVDCVVVDCESVPRGFLITLRAVRKVRS